MSRPAPAVRLGAAKVATAKVAAAMLAAAMLAAAALLAVRLTHPGLWCDEIYTARWTHLPFAALLAALRSDLHPPLFFALERLCVRALGDSDAGVRALPALVALACVPLAAWAFAPSSTPRVAALAALLLAVHPQFVLVAPMARYFSVAMFAGLLAHGAFERALSAPHARRWWLVYAVAAAALLYASYVAASVLLAHGLVALLGGRERRGALRGWLLACVFAALAFAPWLPVLLAQAHTAHALAPAAGAGASPVLAAVLAAVRMAGYTLWAVTASEMAAPWDPLALAGAFVAAALLLAGAVSAARAPRSLTALQSGMFAALIAFALTSVFAPATPFVSVPARTLFVLPFVALLLAHGVTLAQASIARRLRLAPLLVLLVWAPALARSGSGEHWLDAVYATPGREVAAALAARVQPGDAVLADDDTGVAWYLARGIGAWRGIGAGRGVGVGRGFGSGRGSQAGRGFQAGRAARSAPVPACADPTAPGALALATAAPSGRIWYARLARDGSERVRSSAPAEVLLGTWGTCRDSTGFRPYDAAARAWRTRAGLSGHAYRVVLERWQRRDPPPLGL